MSVGITIKVEDDTTQLDTYTSIQLYRATSPAGSYSLITTITLVAGQVYYTYTDTSGTLNSWYHFRFYNATGPVTSDYSNAFQPDGATLLKLRQAAIIKYGAGAVLLSTSGGSSTVVLTTDYSVYSSIFQAKRGKGSSLYPTTGNRTGEARIVSNSDPSTGSFTVGPAMTGALASGDEFEWHWLAPASEWNNAINRAMRRYWYLDRIPVVGLATPEIALSFAPWITQKRQITGLWWYIDSTLEEEPYASSGRWWGIRQDADAISIMTRPQLATTDTAWLEALRQMPTVFTDDSAFPAAMNLELAMALAYDEVLAGLTRPGVGSSQDRKVWQDERVRHATQELKYLIEQETPHPRYSLPQTIQPPNVPMPFKAR